MFYVYVIESINFGRRYVGFTADLATRLNEHNSGKTKSNKAYRPFILIYYEEYKTKEEALAREKYLKSSAGRNYVKKIRPRSSAE